MSKEIKKWEELSREIVFQKYSRKIEKVIFRLQNGEESDYYIKKEGLAVCVLALTKENKVILAKQYRPGMKKILFEMPGGIVDEGETPEDMIKRELLEETGYTGDIEFVGMSYDDAYSTRIRYNYVAKNCYKISDQKLDDTEFIEIVEISLDDFRKHLRSGELTDVESGYLGLDYLKLL